MPPASRVRSRARWIPAALLALLAVVVLVVVLHSSSPAAGYDVSYPQCSGSYPSNPVFAIVGVNGGLAHNANPCLSGQLTWAQGAPGQKRPDQPSVSLYIDTGNPGDHISQWPRGGNTSAYGSCNGLLTNACSYIYGEHQAAYSYGMVSALAPVAARTAPWWLDVELMESWAGTYALNIAALQGFIAGLQNAGVTGPIGIYSTSTQWKEITGLTAETSHTAFSPQLRDWLAEGADETLARARQNCATEGFTGVSPTLVQYRIGKFDADVRCPSKR